MEDSKAVILRPDPNKHFPDGVRVLVGGKFVVWFAKLLDQCEC
jgi:hypothetical protein